MAGLVQTSVSDNVALLRLNRPEARNALSPDMMAELGFELERADADPDVRCIVIAGTDEVFAAGADIRSLSEREFHEALFHPTAEFWKRVAVCAPRWSPPFPAGLWAAAASSPCCVT